MVCEMSSPETAKEASPLSSLAPLPMGWLSLACALGLAYGLYRAYGWWRQRQEENARAALYSAAERPFDCAFAPHSPGSAAGEERLLQTPTTAKSSARVAAASASGSGRASDRPERRWYREALNDVHATQALIRETLEEEDEEAPFVSSGPLYTTPPGR